MEKPSDDINSCLFLMNNFINGFPETVNHREKNLERKSSSSLTHSKTSFDARFRALVGVPLLLPVRIHIKRVGSLPVNRYNCRKDDLQIQTETEALHLSLDFLVVYFMPFLIPSPHSGT